MGFLVNVPVGITTFVVARRVVPDSRDLTVSKTPDLGGSAALAVGIGALALALVQGPDWGWSSAADLSALAAAGAALALFWRRSTRHPLPVVEPTLLRVKTFAWSNVTVVLFSVAFAAGLLAIVLWLQQGWGYSAVRTGFAIAPGPMMVPLFAAVAQRLSARVPPGSLATVGCLLFGTGAALLAMSVQLTPSYATAILPAWLIGGIGVGFALPTIISAATADLPPARAATGSAVVTMARQIGLVLGVSLLVAVLGTPSSHDAVLAAFRAAWWAIAAVSAVAAVAATRMTPRAAR